MDREHQLQTFVQWWKQYCKGDEKGEAQIFLDHLFTAFGYPDGLMQAGGVSEHRIKFTVDEKSTTRFADLVIPGRVLIEMKKRGEDLGKHYPQAISYWQRLVPTPQYMALCNFDEFWIYDMHYQASAPMGKVRVEHLAETYGPLRFLFAEPETPVFSKEFDLVELTKVAAGKLADVFNSIYKKRQAAPREQSQRFILQCMLTLFAEDIGLLPRYTFTQVIQDCLDGKEKSYDQFTLLFTFMNMPGKKKAGRFYGVDYFDGGLFQEIYPIALSPDELRLLREAADYNWGKIRPEIFGTIFEQTTDQDDRRDFGIHYTSEDDIRRIVNPVIARPWSEQIAAAASAEELLKLHTALCQYKVFDPACGSGNFLYVAYRAMKTLERQIATRLEEMGAEFHPAQVVSTKQFYGMDVKPFAVELAKVTLMTAKKLVVDELHSDEPALPLDNLDANITCTDALLTDWPDFDACIGNPPYIGAKRMKQEHPAEYINKVRGTFPDIPGNADYCVYWFNKAHQVMKTGARAGLVGTNTIRQNYSREGGLDIITANDGRIFEAVSSMPWSGEAAVHVSIACWEKLPPTADDNSPRPEGEGQGVRVSRLWLNGDHYLDLPEINSSLSPKTDVSSAQVLSCNTDPKRVFIGQQTGHEAFILEPEKALEMVRKDASSRPVIYPFLIGRDLTGQPAAKPSRYVIDMNQSDSIEAKQFGEAFKKLQAEVLPFREAKAKEESERNERLIADNPKASVNHHHEGFLRQWWKHAWGRPDMISEIEKLPRYIVCSAHTKRPIFDFVLSGIRPDHALIVFCFNDDYSFGIMQSNVHWQWFTEKGSTLTERFRYTPNSVFDTFPWPQNPSPEQVKAVALAGRALHQYRRDAMAKNPRLTLRELYRSLELPGKNPLKDLHTALDKAVLSAYAFNSPRPEGEGQGVRASEGDLLAQLLALNEAVAARITSGETVTSPGVPPNYPNPAELISEGCITPPEWV